MKKWIDVMVRGVPGGDTMYEYATNENGDGLWLRLRDGTWQQVVGTCDFHADTPKELAQNLGFNEICTVDLLKHSPEW